MHRPDAEQFESLLVTLAEAFGKPRPTAELVEVYWRALKDLAFETVKAGSERHLRYGKFFPKPVELRPKEDRRTEETPAQRAQFDTAIAENRRNWDEKFAKDPQMARIELGLAKAARIEVLCHESTPQHAEAHSETVELMAQRAQLMAERRRPA